MTEIPQCHATTQMPLLHMYLLFIQSSVHLSWHLSQYRTCNSVHFQEAFETALIIFLLHKTTWKKRWVCYKKTLESQGVIKLQSLGSNSTKIYFQLVTCIKERLSLGSQQLEKWEDRWADDLILAEDVRIRQNTKTLQVTSLTFHRLHIYNKFHRFSTQRWKKLLQCDPVKQNDQKTAIQLNCLSSISSRRWLSVTPQSQVPACRHQYNPDIARQLRCTNLPPKCPSKFKRHTAFSGENTLKILQW